MTVVAIPEAIDINIAALCDRGKVREENQAIVRRATTRLGDLLVVADGIGNAAGGGQASRLAADTILSSIGDMPAFFPLEIAVEEAVCHANAALAATEPDSPDSVIGATVVVALLRADAGRAPVQAVIGHVGDARAYLLRKRKLTQLTRDHTAVQNLPGSSRTTPPEAEPLPHASVLTRYLGQKLSVQVEVREIQLEAGDTLLLCSNGLWGHIPERQIERTLADQARTVEEASRTLLNLALDAGGHDNVAIQIVRLTPGIDAAAEVASSVELPSEPPVEFESVPAFVPASHTPGSPNSPEISVVEPTVSWVPPQPIIYGAQLCSVQLNATASVKGKFLYTPGPGYILPAGTHTLWVAFYAADLPEDNPVLASVPITVSNAVTSIQPLKPSHVPTVDTTGVAQLSASASSPAAIQLSPAAVEMRIPVQPQATAAAQADATAAPQLDAPLFHSFQPSTDVGREQETRGKKWMIASAFGAALILLLFIFMVFRFNWESSFAVPSVQPPPVSADTQPQPEPGPALQPPLTPGKSLPSATAPQKADNQPGSEPQTANPTQAQAEMMHDQLTAPSQIPQGIKKPVDADTPPAESFGPAGAEGLAGSATIGKVLDAQERPIVSPARPVAISAGVAAGRLIHQSQLVYPPLAKSAHVSGTVELQATISKIGTITDLRVISGPPMLQRGAVDAVRAWRYKPFTLDNKPVEVQTTIDVVFSLDK